MDLDLTTLTGLTVFVGLIVSFAVKPLLHRQFPEDEAGNRDSLYAILVNLVTFVLAFAITAGLSATEWGGIDTIMQALQMAVLVTGSSIGIYEVLNNSRAAVS
jgi:Co/Zn/Cd efflux system component